MNRWLVYLISSCELGSEGWSGWQYHCIAHGNTDAEIYNDWLRNVKKIYDVDLSEDLRCENGRWYCYYPLAKVNLPTSVYGHSKEIKLDACFDKHNDIIEMIEGGGSE